MSPPSTTAAHTCRCVRLRRARPGERRDPQREHDAADPLQRHQAGKQPIGALVNVVRVLSEQLARARCLPRPQLRLSVCCKGISRSSKSGQRPPENSEQPNTFVAVRPGVLRFSSATIALTSVVVTLMRARAGDAACEQQGAGVVVQERLTRRRHAEPARFDPRHRRARR